MENSTLVGTGTFKKFILLIFIGLFTLSGWSQTVTTDKDDYAPGEYVIITGTEWEPGERVDFTFEESPKPETCVNSHDNFAIADANGDIYYDGFLIKENHLGVHFVLSAKGEISGKVAVTEFTDGNVNFAINGSIPNNTDGFTVTVTYTPASPPNAIETTETIGPFKSQNTAAVAAKNGTSINWVFNQNGNYVWDGSSSYVQGFLVNGNYNGSNAVKGNYIICSAPSINSQPSDKSITYGSDVNFSVNSSGTAPINFQWQVNTGSGFNNIADGGIYSGATTSTLSLNKPSVTMGGYIYKVLVSNGCGNTASNAVVLTVNKKALTATSNIESKIYDGSPATGVVSLGTINGLVGSETLNITPSATNYANANVGTGKASTISYSLADGTNGGLADNYSMAAVSTSGDISQRAITITADAKTKIYGDADPALTAQATNVANSDLPTGSLERAAGENVGSYSISKSTYTYGSNYDETFVGANLVIGQRAITITADAKTKTYGDADPALTAQATNVANSDLPSGSLERAAGENVGSYAISKSTYTYGSNYDETFVEANLVIGQRAITITADAKTKTYGDADPALTAQAINVANSDLPTGSLERAVGENVGSYSISKSTYTYGSNYDETFEGANLVIGQRAITITADAKTKTYGDADPALTAQATNVANSDLPTGSLERAVGENVGSYSISKSTYTYGSNYDETFVEANLVIGQRAITITADAKTKTYGDADPALTAQAINVANSDLPSGSLERAVGENVGSYAISKSTYTYGSNYDETFEGANLVIGQRAITITADAKTKTYGDADPALTAQATNVANSDLPTGSLERAAGENVGSYSISKSTYSYGSNYDETFVGANLVIGQRAITITADAKTKTYGDVDPELTAQATNIANSDLPTGSLERAAGENVGNYSISKSTYTYGSNYDETFVGANLVIGQRAITITADAKTKTYGDADPALTAQATNVANSDLPTGSLDRAAGENVGSYSISKSTYTYGSNYDETFEGANLVIGQREITITADAKTKTYGDADPALTAQATNIANSDLPTGSLDRAAGENVGSYAISKSTYTYGNNYDETFVGANLVIGQRAITITADAKTKTYGDADPELTAQATNVANSDLPTGSLERAVGENVGSYSIRKSTYTYGSNYDETFEGANLVIGQRAITITADAKTKTYGDADPALTGQATNIANSDLPTGSLERAVGENVGSYVISKSTYTYGSNYYETFVEANLVIGQREITITADAKTKIYGDADPELTAQATNIANSDLPTGSLERAVGENVGSYSISKSTYTYGSNYDETFVEANLVIGQREITITADAKTKIYGDADPALTAQATNIANSDLPTGSLDRAAGENVGSYPISKSTYTYGSNYDETFVEANLIIGQRAITITADAKTKTYGDADPALTAQATNIVNSDLPTGSLDRAAGENVGSYSISKSTYTYGSNYDETFVEANLVIGQREITITADAKIKTYGDVDPALTAQATNIANSDLPTGSLERAVGENVGSYAISKSTYTYGSNYDETFVGANLVIGQRAITITADAKTKTYGDADPALTAQATNIANSDLPTGSLERAVGENVGSYAISKSTYTYGSNYYETFVEANLVIGQRAITITADAKTKTYGDADPALTAQATNIVNSDLPTGSLERAAGENVGSYSISKSTYTYGSNYDETFVEANLVIGQRAITITAEAKTKTYGDADPALTAQATNVANSDLPTGSLERAAGENVGSYSISKSTYTYGSNYAETFEGANLVIGQRAITITPNPNQYKYCGQADPTFGYSSSETLISGNSFSGELNRLGSNEVGTYAYTIGTLGAGSNYLLTLSAINTFTIKGIAIDASASSNPVGIGSIATLSAAVTPNVPGVIVNFYLNDVLKGSSLTNNLGVATLSVPNLSVDVYKVHAVAGSGCSTSDAYLPVYDPNGGFVTGGGWIYSDINSMQGSYANAKGKANFGFNAKYKNGKNNMNEVDGNTNFQFKEGDLDFKSSAHDDMSLVISGAKATYRGHGTVNGSGNHKFLVVAIDGDENGGDGIDKFRIKIWKNNSNDVLYDNKWSVDENSNDATALGGGSIVIHKPKGKSQESILADKPIIMQDLTPETLELLAVSPNPVISSSIVRFSIKDNASVLLQLYDYSGRLIETLFNGSAQSYKNYDVNFERKNLMSGIYILKLSTNGHSYDQRMIIK